MLFPKFGMIRRVWARNEDVVQVGNNFRRCQHGVHLLRNDRSHQEIGEWTVTIRDECWLALENKPPSHGSLSRLM